SVINSVCPVALEPYRHRPALSHSNIGHRHPIESTHADVIEERSRSEFKEDPHQRGFSSEMCTTAKLVGAASNHVMPPATQCEILQTVYLGRIESCVLPRIYVIRLKVEPTPTVGTATGLLVEPFVDLLHDTRSTFGSKVALKVGVGSDACTHLGWVSLAKRQ